MTFIVLLFFFLFLLGKVVELLCNGSFILMSPSSVCTMIFYLFISCVKILMQIPDVFYSTYSLN